MIGILEEGQEKCYGTISTLVNLKKTSLLLILIRNFIFQIKIFLKKNWKFYIFLPSAGL